MISFKQLEKKDFDLLTAWMNYDFASRWYSMRKFIYDDVEKKYQKNPAGYYPVFACMIMLDEEPIGYAQMYRLSDYPIFASCLDVMKNSSVMDIFIGDKKFIYKNLGKTIIELFVKNKVFKDSAIVQCVTAIEQGEKPAIRAYEKAGFKKIKVVDCNGVTQVVMGLRKTEDHIVYPVQEVD
jgi:hypothetical protein